MKSVANAPEGVIFRTTECLARNDAREDCVKMDSGSAVSRPLVSSYGPPTSPGGLGIDS